MSTTGKRRNNKVQGITSEEVLVANSASTSGDFAHTGNAINAGIQAYFDMVNAEGGIDNRKIRFLHTDDQHDPKKAAEIFDTMVNREKVFAYVGHFGSDIVKETLNDIRRIGIPVVYFATGIGELYTEHACSEQEGLNCYPIQPIYVAEGKEMVRKAAERFHASKIGILYTPEDMGLDIKDGAEQQAEYMNISCKSFDVGRQNSLLEEAVAALKKENVEFVIIAAAQNLCPDIVHRLAESDINKPTITSYVNGTITISRKVVDVIAGKFDLYVHSWLNYEGENVHNLEEASKWLGDYAIDGHAHCGWIGAHFLCEGLRRLAGKVITWENFVEAMERAPIKIPFGGIVDYALGKRTGVTDFNLWKADKNSHIGWVMLR